MLTKIWNFLFCHCQDFSEKWRQPALPGKASSSGSWEKPVISVNLGNCAAFPSKEMVLKIAYPEWWHFVVNVTLCSNTWGGGETLPGHSREEQPNPAEVPALLNQPLFLSSLPDLKASVAKVSSPQSSMRKCTQTQIRIVACCRSPPSTSSSCQSSWAWPSPWWVGESCQALQMRFL